MRRARAMQEDAAAGKAPGGQRGRPAARAIGRWTVTVVAAALVLVTATAIAEAQGYRRPGRSPYDGYARVRVIVYPSGPYVGAGLVTNRILDQSGGPELVDSGSGLALFGGWRLSQRLALELGWMATFHDPGPGAVEFGPDAGYLVLTGYTGDAKIYLGEDEQRIEPYLQAGVGLYLLESSDEGEQSVGSGFQAGGGVDFHVASHVDVGLRVLYRGIAMGPPQSDEEDTFISALGGEANVSLRF